MSEDGEEEYTPDGERILPGEVKQIKGNWHDFVTMFSVRPMIVVIKTWAFIFTGPSVESRDGEKKMDQIEEHIEDESKALISDLSDLTSASTSRRQLDAGTLDAKVVKALKKQEEKREKRASRKKEVQILKIVQSA